MFEEKLEYLRSIADIEVPLQSQVRELIGRFESGHSDTTELLSNLHEAQRIVMIYEAGAENNAELLTKLEQSVDPLWSEMEVLSVDKGLLENLARMLYAANKPSHIEKVFINLSKVSRVIGEVLVDLCIEEDVSFEINFYDHHFKAILVSNTQEEGIERLANLQKLSLHGVNRDISIRHNPTPEVANDTDIVKMKAFDSGQDDFLVRRRAGETNYVLTRIPSEADAEIDQILFDDYIKLFFELCDQPWDRIKQAQAILIEKFDEAIELHITNSDGTDVTMLLKNDDVNMTFANSVIARNIPGSEIFSGPIKDSVNGIIVAKGNFKHDSTDVIKDITLEFENGKIVSFTAAENEKDLSRLFEEHENSQYVGEIGIGTNPHLRMHVVNSLLVEKIGGSFHLGIGNSYPDGYLGDVVKMNNGNKSTLHWDVTTMLHGKEGKMYLDGELVQDSGVWLDPALAVLNEGWSVVPESERSEYWNQKISEEGS